MGDIYPPALNMPQRPEGMTVVQRGDRLILAVRMPQLTTERLPLDALRAEFYAGPVRTQANWEDWIETAQKQSGVSKAGAEVQAEFSVKALPEGEVHVVTRAVNPKGRAGEWSQAVIVRVVRNLQAPSEIVGESVPDGVRLRWQGRGDQYRVFRRTGKEEPQVVATVNRPEYVDTAVLYDVDYVYAVQTITGGAESELSAAFPFIHRDKFPPPVPAGFSVETGVNAVELTWDPSSASDFAAYRVYRGEEEGELKLIANQVARPAYSDTQVMSGKRYRYQVTAVDNAGNESSRTEIKTGVAP